MHRLLKKPLTRGQHLVYYCYKLPQYQNRITTSKTKGQMNEFCYEKVYILLETNPQWRSEKSDCYTYLRGQGAHYDNNEPEKGKVSINEENQRYC